VAGIVHSVLVDTDAFGRTKRERRMTGEVHRREAEDVRGVARGAELVRRRPLAPVLLEKLGGSPTDVTQLMPLLSSIIVCGFIVDLSPLSTTGAVFLANAAPETNKTRLFRDMLIWGLSMSVVGALISWLAFTVMRLP